ncbi:MAG: SemiSWEET transporter [Hyphomonadaceae bacterium]
MPLAEITGSIAALLTTVSFVPQAVMVVRTRNTSGISLLMYAMFTAGITFWFIYGLMTGSWPIIIANGITIVLAATILVITTQNTLRARETERLQQPVSNSA